MQTITVILNAVNFEALDDSLRAALGAEIIGISYKQPVLRIHLRDGAAPALRTQARAIASAHDPDSLSPRQQARKQREQALAAARAENSSSLKLDDFAAESTTIRTLARKLYWLELELRHQRGE